jgi:hypothetical protein
MMMRVSNYSNQAKARRDGKQAHASINNNQADVAQQKEGERCKGKAS